MEVPSSCKDYSVSKSIDEALKPRLKNVIEEEEVIFAGSDAVRAVVHL